jgi:CRP-like cAMP-binding protein
MMEQIVKRLGTAFSTPEALIIEQDEPSNYMYYISSGDCAVNILDNNREEKIAHRLLVEGDHFGEIGLIFNCCRTATV